MLDIITRQPKDPILRQKNCKLDYAIERNNKQRKKNQREKEVVCTVTYSNP